MNNLKHTDEIVADLVSEYVDQMNAGGKISLERFLAAHSEYSAALRPLLQSAMTVREVAAIPYANASGRAAAFDSVMARLQKEEPGLSLRIEKYTHHILRPKPLYKKTRKVRS